MMAKILIVDDEESIVKALDKRLTRMGHDVVTARDGMEAWERFDPEDFDLLITDFRMPRMDGLELLKRVKNLAGSFPVIVITGTASHNPEIFLEHGAQHCLLKPVSKTDLVATLQKVLPVA
jgi:CheY-like chemotaxis protein